jgi:eukaryotic-like serine/threonine-protein kinase
LNPACVVPLSEPATLLCQSAAAPIDDVSPEAESGVRAPPIDVHRNEHESEGVSPHADPVGADGEAASPAAGSVIGGVYRVLARLGSGGMGVVLLARDETLDRRVAIKLIQPGLLRPDARERFGEEARAMARVSHPNVLQIYSVGEHDHAPYFVMEFVEGPTLEQWLFESGSPPDLDIGLAILEGTCRGVIAIHAANTIHRDVKPGNILLDSHLRPRVADLGVAVICRPDRPSRSEIVGTALYMAPEIALRRPVSPLHHARADVYSLGCLAYELLTGQPPFCGESDFETMVLHANSEAIPPSRLRPGLLPEFDDVLARALAKDPSERTRTVEAFLREITTARIGDREPVRILLAEDNDEFRETLILSLAAEWPAVEIESCGDGIAALEAFDRQRPSAALLDLRMPGLDGMQLTALLRSRDPAHAVPILILTASGGPEEWSRLSALGADGFLVKPVVLADVVAMVRRCLRTSEPRFVD